MDTFEEQKAFFLQHWPFMRSAAEAGGADAVVAYVRGFDDDRERRVLFTLARQGLVMSEWEERDLDLYVAVARAGIDEALAQAERVTDDAERRKLTNSANVISYNLSADLADCWPDDGFARESRHFQAGLEAATDCVAWREELGMPAWSRSMAHWAKGMHELSLGQTEAAVLDWRTSLDFAVTNAEEQGDGTEANAEGEFAVVLSTGLLGLAQLADGDASGEVLFAQAMEAFEAQQADEELAEDAQFGAEQLGIVRDRYVDDQD